jgi:hypothetical protein
MSGPDACSLAYADPPYPGMSGLYPENTEVDHVELIARLCEYDGWALSTDERSLAYVLPLCPPGTRVLALCRTNAPPFNPNPAASWEPVLCIPARVKPVTTRSYLVAGPHTGFLQRDGITGAKPPAFCEWIIRCLGAQIGDTLDDIFPGTGSMGHAWETFQSQPPLFSGPSSTSRKAAENFARRTQTPLDGLEPPRAHSERDRKVDRGKGRRAAA